MEAACGDVGVAPVLTEGHTSSQQDDAQGKPDDNPQSEADEAEGRTSTHQDDIQEEEEQTRERATGEEERPPLVLRKNATCHRCKTLKPRLWVCPREALHRWCEACLRIHYQIAFASAPEWPGLASADGCPVCQRVCTCPGCARRRASGKWPMPRGRPRLQRMASTGRQGSAKQVVAVAAPHRQSIVRLGPELPGQSWTKTFDRDGYHSSLSCRYDILSVEEGSTPNVSIVHSLHLLISEVCGGCDRR
jgi:hypothetical protein